MTEIFFFKKKIRINLKTVMEKFSRGIFSVIADVVLVFFEPSSPHNSQRIDGNTDATNNTTKTTHTNTYYHILAHTNTYYKHIPPHTTTYQHNQTPPTHNTHFQHRYRPTSFQVARSLHSYARTVVSCMIRTCSANKDWAKVHAL